MVHEVNVGSVENEELVGDGGFKNRHQYCDIIKESARFRIQFNTEDCISSYI